MKEMEIYHCDICGEETTNIIKCSICKKDICSKSSCRAWNQCTECWDKNESYASIESKSETDTGYEGRTYTTLIIKHKSPNKWRELLSRFYGNDIKITIEEVISDEERENLNELNK